MAHQLEDENIWHDERSTAIVSRLLSIIWDKQAGWKDSWKYLFLGHKVVWHTRMSWAGRHKAGDAWLTQGSKCCLSWKEVMNRGWLRVYSQDNVQQSTQPVSALLRCIPIWSHGGRQHKNCSKVQMTYKTLTRDWKSIELMVTRGRHKSILRF